MEQTRPIRDFVMEVIADHYQDFPVILREVTDLAAQRGLPVTPGDVSETLQGLITEGLAKSYHLGWGAEEIKVAPERFTDPDCYFLLTEAGKQAITK